MTRRLISNLINVVLSKFGVKLVRHVNFDESNFIRENHIYVELIGPSGVGKSTVLSQIDACLLSGWVTRDLFPNDFNALKKQNFDIHSVYSNLLNLKMISLSNHDMSFELKLRLLKYMIEVLVKDISFTNGYGTNVIFDEGLFHNFASELPFLDDECLDFLIKDRGFIFFESETDFVISNVRKRQGQSPEPTHNPFHIGKSDDELRTIIEKSKREISNLKDLLLARKVPVCVVRPTDSADARKQISDFLTRIQVV